MEGFETAQRMYDAQEDERYANTPCDSCDMYGACEFGEDWEICGQINTDCIGCSNRNCSDCPLG